MYLLPDFNNYQQLYGQFCFICMSTRFPSLKKAYKIQFELDELMMYFILKILGQATWNCWYSAIFLFIEKAISYGSKPYGSVLSKMARSNVQSNSNEYFWYLNCGL